MTQGFSRVQEIPIGEHRRRPIAPRMRGKPLLPVAADGIGNGDGCGCGCRSHADARRARHERTPLTRIDEFDDEVPRRATATTSRPAPFASLGVMAAGTGDTASKYVARRETPVYIAENCTQCMECITACPDTALPNCSQDLETVLRTAVTNYVTDAGERQKMLASLPEIEKRTRELMRDAVAKNEKTPFKDIIREVTNVVDGFSPEAKSQFFAVIDKVPLAYQKTNAIFATPEKKTPGAGGVFSIFVSDLCKGCAACVTACGDHEALRMVQETEEVNAEHETGTRVPRPAARHAAEVPRPLQRHAPAGLQDRHAAQHADGAAQLRRARFRRRRLRRSAARRASSRPSRRSPRPTCARSSTRRRTASGARPISWRRTASASSRRSRREARRNTRCSVRPSRTC